MEPPSRASFLSLAAECGFELSGVARALPVPDLETFNAWLADGLAGPLNYLTDHRADVRADPRQLLPTVKTVLCLGKLYKTQDIQDPPISRYAWGEEDYHNTLRRDLSLLRDRLIDAWGPFDSRICVDTAPLLERSYARQAGLGWIGRNTCLINEPRGSWFFLGEILVSIELPPDSPPPDRCGTCRRCIDACPTSALVPGSGVPGPAWRLDSSACISTLTIEIRGNIPEARREGIGHHVFGCDICQEVCPWNRRSPESAEPGFQPGSDEADLAEWAAMTPDEFRRRFRRTPLWRVKYSGWLRNLAVAMGNSKNPRYKPALERLAGSGDPVVEEHARWALGRIAQEPEQ